MSLEKTSFLGFDDPPLKSRFVLEWENITVRSKRSKFSRLKALVCKEKVIEEPPILNSVYGSLESGQLVALLGSSGCGKTTLLSAVTDRLTDNFAMEGRVTLNGRVTPSRLRRNLAFVDQFESFPTNITAREHLVFNALLRLDRSISYQEKLAFVDKTIQSFSLTDCADTVIGIPSSFERGISGGERRRLAFATEALLNPPLFFCDEPTSGLDSFMSMKVIKTMKSLCQNGCGILCSIHQPSSSAVALFDKVMLMAEGRVAYFGQTDKALDFFSRMGFNCRKNNNPTDFFIGLLETRNKLWNIDQVQKICNEFYDIYELAKQEEHFSMKWDEAALRSERTGYAVSWLSQTWILTKRELSVIKHLTPVSFLKSTARMCIYLVMGCLMRVHLPLHQHSVISIIGLSAWISNTASANYTQNALEEFQRTLPLFYKERKKNMYSSGAYFISISIYQLCVNLFHALLVVTPFYWTIGMLLTLAFRERRITLAIWRSLTMVLFSFNHFFHSNGSFPVYISWLGKIAWPKYAMESITINFWRYFEGPIECDKVTTGCLRNGEDVLNKVGIADVSLVANIALMLAIGFSLRILVFLILYFESRA